MIFKTKTGKTTKQLLNITTYFSSSAQYLKNYELLRFCNILFRFAEQLPQNQEIFYSIDSTIKHNNGFDVQEVNIKKNQPSLEDFKVAVKSALDVIHLSQEDIKFLLSFARTEDKMKADEQLLILAEGEIDYVMHQVLENFLDELVQHTQKISVPLEKLQVVIKNNLMTGKKLTFWECIIATGLTK